MSDDLIGKTLGGYEILDRIDQGGMATVYRARQTSMNRVVALKILPRHFLRDDTYLRRFEREVEIIAQLEHRNIVPVYDYGESDNQPYIAMRYMPAGSINDLLKIGPIDIKRTLEIVEQVAPALDYAHTRNILHRDLKPSNLLLDDTGDAYITDFGIARIVGMESKGATITTQGVVGTPSYMSPEQAQGKEMDGRSDIYSLGITVFEMLTARRPFENETPYGIAVMQVTMPPPSPRDYNEDVSPAVEQVILKALKKKREQRYQTAVEMAQALKMAVERPDSVHDTEPRGILINSSAMAQTKPTPTQALLPSGQPIQSPPQPVYTPPPSQLMQPPASSVGLRKEIRRPRSQSGGVILSVVLGMVIGCTMLTALVAALILTLDNLFDRADTSIVSNPLPTLDATSEAARQGLVPGAGGVDDPDATPVFSNATPIPSRTPTEEPEANGTGSRDPTPTFDPSFSLDFAQIVYFAQRDGDYDLFRYDLISGEESVVIGNSATNSYPMYSPDGSSIVYQSNADGDFDIYVYDISSRSNDKLTDNDVLDRLPAWSPDGEWIVYSSDTRGDGNLDLMMMRADGSDQRVIYSDGRRNSHPRFSNDARMIVFTNGEAGDANTWEIALFDLQAGEVRLLTDNEVRDSSPSFSPDDSQILFVTDGASGAALAIMSLDNPEGAVILYDGSGYEWGGVFSPDGAFILFTEEREGNALIQIMPADGSSVRLIDNKGGFYPSWIP